MPIRLATPENIAAAAKVLRSGGLVALPTETVYGLGANALDPVACAGIFAAKERPFFDPLIVHVADGDMVEQLTTGLGDAARLLAKRFWPGPLTMVLRKSAEGVPDIVTSGLPTVAVRMPSHPVALELIRLAGCPVAAPSANLFGRLSPTTAEHVADQLGGRADFILDGGPCAVGVESTIIDLSGDTPKLLRPGGVSLEQLQSVLPSIIVVTGSTEQPTAPGQLATHYAPRTPLVIFDEHPPQVSPGQKLGLLTLRPSPDAHRFAAAVSLSDDGDLAEAATNLFAALHRLDSANLQAIHAQALPRTGLGRAMMDRLERAQK
ncbi:MAG: L-threonylcarbamoyladenylate synthase [Pirellulales bacterium]